VSGYLDSVQFEDGQLVSAGDLLFVIDPRPYQAILDEATAQRARAQTQLDLARNDLERDERLLNERAISAEDYDTRSKAVKEAEASLLQADAQVEAAKLNLEFTEVRSPIDGRVSSRYVDVGNLISGGSENSTVLTTVVSLDPIHVVFTASEQDYLRYSRMARSGERPSSRDVAKPVQVKLADEDAFTHEGRMDFVDNRLDPSTGTMKGRAILDNDDMLLTPGMFVTLRLLGSGAYQAVLIPDQAIGADQAQKFVFVVGDDNIAHFRTVAVGPIIDGLRVVRQGLRPGETIIIEGLQRVRDGAPVTPDRVDLGRWMRRGEMPPGTPGAPGAPSESAAPADPAASGAGAGGE